LLAGAQATARVIPDRLGELVTRGLKPSGEASGAAQRRHREDAQAGKEWRFVELVFEGSIIATRVEGGLRLKGVTSRSRLRRWRRGQLRKKK